MAEVGGVSAVWRTLKILNYRHYMWGNFCSQLGMWVQRIAIQWLTWELTHSPTWLGIFGPIPLQITTGPVDGLAAICVANLEVHRSAEIFLRAMFRRPMADRLDATVWHGFRELIVEADPPSPFQADGEHLGIADRLVVTDAPEALLTLRPRVQD